MRRSGGIGISIWRLSGRRLTVARFFMGVLMENLEKEIKKRFRPCSALTSSCLCYNFCKFIMSFQKEARVINSFNFLPVH